MGFVLSVIATVAVLLFIFVMLNRHYGQRPSSSSGLRSGWAQQGAAGGESPDLVQEDVRQMRLAHQELRQRRGGDGFSDDDLRNAVSEDELNRSRGRGPFGLD